MTANYHGRVDLIGEGGQEASVFVDLATHTENGLMHWEGNGFVAKSRLGVFMSMLGRMVQVRLPDGRTGSALVREVDHEDAVSHVSLVGQGPAPYAQEPSYHPPADLVWSADNITEYAGQRWMLFTRSADLGKRGWSGTDEWHLTQPLNDNGTAYDPDNCRWLASPGKKGLRRAKQLAAWIVANQAAADAMHMGQIEAIVFPDAAPN